MKKDKHTRTHARVRARTHAHTHTHTHTRVKNCSFNSGECVKVSLCLQLSCLNFFFLIPSRLSRIQRISRSNSAAEGLLH